MGIKSTDECDVQAWADDLRKVLDEFVEMVKRNERDEYPPTALPGEWDEWFMTWEGDE